jgi:hypothetical protein
MPADFVAAHAALLQRAGLPVRAPALGIDRFVDADARGQEGRSRRDPLRGHRSAGAAPACARRPTPWCAT